MTEYWDIYNKNGEKKYKVVKKGSPLLSGEYHIIVEGWIRTGKETYLIQKRSKRKKSFGGMWYCSVGGSVISGEEPIDGLLRETKEELGIDLDRDKIYLKRIIRENNGIFYIYLIDMNVNLEDVKLQEEEVEDAKIASVDEIFRMIDEGILLNLSYYRDFFNSAEKLIEAKK